MAARIFSIVDVFDALTSKRPYKEAFSYEKSVETLQESSGTHFDSVLLERFVKMSSKLYEDTGLKPQEVLKEELDVLIKRYFLD